MKLIIAIIQPFKLDEVREGLAEIGVQGMTTTEVKGFGRQKGHKEIYRGAEYTINYVPKIKLEIVVSDELASRTTTVIQNKAKTGNIGDGKIFTVDVEAAIRVRTGESGDEAL